MDLTFVKYSFFNEYLLASILQKAWLMEHSINCEGQWRFKSAFYFCRLDMCVFDRNQREMPRLDLLFNIDNNC